MVPIAPARMRRRWRKRASKGWRSAAMGGGELSGIWAKNQATNLRIMICRYVLKLPLPPRLSGRGRTVAKPSEKRLALAAQFLFQFFGAIAIAARPRFSPIFVPAIPARMRVLDAEE